ncbi:MAG: O-antigen ligase family protein [Solirubrobacterales bacterium]
MASAQPRIPIALPEPLPAAGEGVARFGLPLLSVALLGALGMALFTDQPLIAIAIPAVALGAIACVRRPVAAILTVFVLSGLINTVAAFTPIPPNPLVDYVLLGLWVGVAGIYLSGGSPRVFWLWPALLAPLLYLVVTLFGVLLVDPFSDGFDAFRAAAWYMAAMVLVAVAPLSREMHLQIARGIAVVGLIIGLYLFYRWQVGPSGSENLAAAAAQPQRALQQRFFGSFLSPFQLAQWTATLIPFLLALGLAWRGKWRLIAFAGIALLATALLASDVRTAVISVAAGLIVVLAMYLAAPAFPGRLAIGMATLLGVVVFAAAGYALTVGSSDVRTERYARILNPTEDEAYTDRLLTWEIALDEMAEEPWGHGLGTAGGAAEKTEAGIEFGAVASEHLDSSYIKVGLEQGFAVMLLFAAGMIGLLVGMGARALRIHDPERAALVIGGAGALAALIPLFYAGLYSEGMPVVAAWLLVGLGVAQATLRPASERGLAGRQVEA